MTVLGRLTLVTAGAFALTYCLGFRRGFYFCQEDIRAQWELRQSPYWIPAEEAGSVKAAA